MEVEIKYGDCLKKIINHYGVMKQLKYFQTEVFELNEAIINHETGLTCEYEIPLTEAIHNKEHIEEEMADVLMMLDQFIEYYNLDFDKISKIMQYKMERQLDRIVNEQEGNN